MLVSTKGRYAMRLMINIARIGSDSKVALRYVAQDESISLKYLEQLAHTLVKGGLLVSVRGHGGGYALARDASDIRAGDILRAAEGTTAPVACKGLEETCPREKVCSTVQFWAGLDRAIEEYVDSITLAQLAAGRSDVEGLATEEAALV